MTKTADSCGRIRAVLSRLAACDAEAADRACRAIDDVLAGTRRSAWSGAAWQASDLTPGGFPLEFAWSSRDASVRWTSEVTGPEVPPPHRFSAALAMLRKFGHEPELPAGLGAFSGKGRRFGAWLGGRHDRLRDRYKLYVEVPADEGGAFARSLLPSDVIRSVPRRVEWRMAGFSLEDGIVELYGRINHHELWEIERLLVRSGFHAAPLADLTYDLAGLRAPEYALPGTTGVTLTVAGDGVMVAAGWFGFAQYLLGSDLAVWRALSRITDEYGWDGRMHDAIVGDVADTAARYGMIGAGIGQSGTPWIQAGCRP